jgi:transcription-repair coupling factor (superfamily II helicase)
LRRHPDQKKAIEYVKRSMESERPMDVLVCADVGFWQDRDSAIRAAFKAAENGKQVLMLVPLPSLQTSTTTLFGKDIGTIRSTLKY